MAVRVADDEPSTCAARETGNASVPGAVRGRLLYLLSRYPGVSHTFFLNEVRSLRRIGFDIDVASINPSDLSPQKLSPEEALEAATTFYVKSAGVSGAFAAALGKLFSDPRGFLRGLCAAVRIGGWEPRSALFGLFYFLEALLVGSRMQKRGLTHLHIHFCGPVATVGLLVLKTWGIPYSLTVHGPEEFYDVSKLHMREKIESARFIFCISEFCRSQLMLLVDPAHWAKMRVIRLGIEPDVFVPNRSAREDAAPLTFLCVGRLVPAKGQMILLEACRSLRDRGRKFKVVLIGSGPDRENLERFACRHELPVTFAGACSHADTLAKLREADVFALASFAEGVPVALMEAMAMEVPCVSTAIAGIPELIRSGIDGVLVSPSSVEELAEALDRLLLDPALRRKLGASGRLRVLDRYNLRKNILLLGEALQELL